MTDAAIEISKERYSSSTTPNKTSYSVLAKAGFVLGTTTGAFLFAKATGAWSWISSVWGGSSDTAAAAIKDGAVLQKDSSAVSNIVTVTSIDNEHRVSNAAVVDTAFLQQNIVQFDELQLSPAKQHQHKITLQSMPLFVQSWSSSDMIRNVKQTPDGGYILRTESYVIKFNSTGSISWTTQVGSCCGLGYVEAVTDGYLVTGGTFAVGSGGTTVLTKFDLTGTQLWTKTFDVGSGYDNLELVYKTSDGGYVLGGDTYGNGAGLYDVALAKINSTGIAQWTIIFGGGADDAAQDVCVTSDGGYLLGGFTSSATASADLLLFKVDSSGNKLWGFALGGSQSDSLLSVKELNAGGYLFSGNTDSVGAGQTDFIIGKIDPSGNVVWLKTFGSTGIEKFEFWEVTTIQLLSDDSAVIVGSTNSIGVGGYDVLLLKIDANGNKIWAKSYGTASNDNGYSITDDGIGGSVIAVTSNNNGVLFHADSNGHIVSGCWGEQDVTWDTINATLQRTNLAWTVQNKNIISGTVTWSSSATTITPNVLCSQAYNTTNTTFSPTAAPTATPTTVVTLTPTAQPTAQPTTSSNIPSNGLVAYYPFNGNANDASGYSNNAAVNNAVLTTDRFGNTNGAYDFNGANSEVVIPHTSQLTAIESNGSVTMAAWAYPRSWYPSSSTFIIVDAGNFRWKWEFGSTGTGFDSTFCGGFGCTASPEMSLNNWHHLTAVCDSVQKTGSIYINGTLQCTQSGLSGVIAGTTNSLRLGNGLSGGQEWSDGKIDEFVIYNRVLSQGEITALYSNNSTQLALTAPPTSAPTTNPTIQPTLNPTINPSGVPTSNPSYTPSAAPSAAPTAATPPSSNPTAKPSAAPSSVPTAAEPATANPTGTPAASPSSDPTFQPSGAPSSAPTVATPPTTNPTSNPSAAPTQSPSIAVNIPSDATTSSSTNNTTIFAAAGAGAAGAAALCIGYACYRRKQQALAKKQPQAGVVPSASTDETSTRVAFDTTRGADYVSASSARIAANIELVTSASAPSASASAIELQQPKSRSIARSRVRTSVSATGVVPLIPWQEVTLDQKLGEGGFGIVYEGTWKHSGKVAIKQIKGMLGADAAQELQEEAGVMASLNSEYVVRLFGLCWDHQKYAMVMELMPNGSLYELLHNKQELPWNIRYQIAQDIAYGLRLLHARNILHRDLKSLNVLLDARLRAKLTDFGLAKVKSHSSRTSTMSKGSVGTIAWMAPELFGLHPKYSEASDIYGFGMVAWELATREIPYKEVKDQMFIKEAIKAGQREDIPHDSPKSFADLIRACWVQDPKRRISADRVVEILEKIISVEEPMPTLQKQTSYQDNDLTSLGKISPKGYFKI